MTSKTTFLSTCTIAAIITSNTFGVVALFEDFEDSTVTYTINSLSDYYTGARTATDIGEASDLPIADYISRVNYTETPNGTLSNQQGSAYFGVEDLNSTATHGSALSAASLTFSSIDISTFGTDFSFSAYFGEVLGTAESWDHSGTTSDLVGVFARVDGGSWSQFFQIAASVVNGGAVAPAVDLNLDGLGEGAEINEILTNYSVDLGSLGAGSLLDVEIRFNALSSANEDIAIDNVTITGVVPEPSTTLLLSLFTAMSLFKRSRK